MDWGFAFGMFIVGLLIGIGASGKATDGANKWRDSINKGER